MALGTNKILGPDGANMIDSSGELTQAHREKFVFDVTNLLLNGNENGLGLQKTCPLWAIPTPPIPGPTIILDPIKPSPEFLFWFKSQPFATLAAPVLVDKNQEYQKLILETIYVPLVKMLNLNGKTSLGPIIDPTIVGDTTKFNGVQIPDLPAIMAKIFLQVSLGTPVAKLNLYNEFGISELQFGDLFSLLSKPPDLSPPSFSIPSPPIPKVPNLGSPSFVLPKLALQIFQIPASVLPQLMTLITSPAIDPPGLLTKIVEIIIDIVLKILKSLGFLIGLPKILSATLTVIIKNLAGMLLCDLVGSLLGTGLIVKVVASLIGVT